MSFSSIRPYVLGGIGFLGFFAVLGLMPFLSLGLFSYANHDFWPKFEARFIVLRCICVVNYFVLGPIVKSWFNTKFILLVELSCP